MYASSYATTNTICPRYQVSVTSLFRVSRITAPEVSNVMSAVCPFWSVTTPIVDHFGSMDDVKSVTLPHFPMDSLRFPFISIIPMPPDFRTLQYCVFIPMDVIVPELLLFSIVKLLYNNLIHEYTTNDNCKCIRFKNINLQICFGTFTATASLNANGDWYTGNSSSITNGSFAQPFTKIYSTQITQGASDWVALLRTDVSYSGISQITLGYNHSYSNTTFSFNYVVYGAYL